MFIRLATGKAHIKDLGYTFFNYFAAVELIPSSCCCCCCCCQSVDVDELLLSFPFQILPIKPINQFARNSNDPEFKFHDLSFFFSSDRRNLTNVRLTHSHTGPVSMHMKVLFGSAKARAL